MENNISDKIDLYLDGKLPPEEKTAFENELSTNSELRQQVETQRNLRQGIERLQLKSTISSQFRKMTLKSKIYKWGIATIVVAAIGTASYFGYNQMAGNNYTLPKLNEEGKAEWSTADKNLPTQTFSIDPNKDTVLETEGGIVFAIPAGAFVDAKDPVTLEVREALTPMDIMKAGLSTTSDGKLLETGGMFYLNARNGEQSLKINPAKSIYANVPTNEVKPEMMVFDGERRADGSINWKNPKPLEKQLIPVDIHLLDFYPKGFHAKVAELGFDANDKKVTDSIYYSYAGRKQVIKYITSYYDEVQPLVQQDTSSIIYQTDPGMIASIWNDKFQNTIISTKEFEERLQAIFQIKCYSIRNELLNLYINNLDKSIFQIDSLADNLCSSSNCSNRNNPFHAFYLRHDGGIMIDQSHFQKLKEYFEMQLKATELAAEMTRKTILKKERSQDSIYSSQKAKNYLDSIKRVQTNFSEEYKINLKEAYRQLGIKEEHHYCSGGGGGTLYYSFFIKAIGWKNVDRFVFDATFNRKTLDYTDPISGKEAIIRYAPLIIDVDDAKQFDQLFVYLVPDSLSSYMKIENKNGRFEESLNELLNYKLVAMGTKGNKWYCCNYGMVKAGKAKISLTETSKDILTEKINSDFKSTVANGFMEDVEMIITEKNRKQILKQRKQQEDVDFKIMKVIFPVYSDLQLQPKIVNRVGARA